MPSVILLDVAGVIVGTLAGCAMKKHISGSLNESINLALSVISAAVGVGLLGKAVHMSAAVLALLIGGTIGHIIGIDRRLANISNASSGNRWKRNSTDTSGCLYIILYQHHGNHRRIDTGI